jgi:hypothetical protein
MHAADNNRLRALARRRARTRQTPASITMAPTPQRRWSALHSAARIATQRAMTTGIRGRYRRGGVEGIEEGTEEVSGWVILVAFWRQFSCNREELTLSFHDVPTFTAGHAESTENALRWRSVADPQVSHQPSACDGTALPSLTRLISTRSPPFGVNSYSQWCRIIIAALLTKWWLFFRLHDQFTYAVVNG